MSAVDNLTWCYCAVILLNICKVWTANS